MDAKRIVVLEGDETGQELLEQSLRVLAPDVIDLELELPRFDLSLESRRATRNAVVYDAAAAVSATCTVSYRDRCTCCTACTAMALHRVALPLHCGCTVVAWSAAEGESSLKP